MGTTVRSVVVLLSVLGLALAGVVPAVGGATAGPTASATDEHAPPDPETDRLGWEAGYWYNESLPVTTGDGLNRSERRAFVARTAARVERIRQLEFDTVPEVNVVSRDRYAAYVDSRFANQSVSTEQRLHQNTKFEALFVVGEETDYFDVQRRNQGGFASAFYTAQGIPQLDVGEGEIAIIADTTDSGAVPVFSPSTLAHELTHALQDQRFPGALDTQGATQEAYYANLSLTEGDATFVGQTYDQRCGPTYDCLTATQSGGGGRIANFGLAIYSFVPYGNTGAFVGHIVETRGYETLNGFYEGENPPVSTEQFIHPERYPDDRPREVTVADRSTEEWNVLELPNGSVDYATFGEGGIFAMLWYPSRQSGQEVIVPLTEESNDPLVRFDFAREPSTGWDGDKLYPYVNGSSAETNETAYVWKTAWDSPEEAAEFADAYRELLEYYGAQPVEGAEDAYVIHEGRNENVEGAQEFGDAFALVVEGDTVTIVNAPALADLNEVREGVVPADARAPTPTPTPTPFEFDSPTPTPTESPSPTATATPTSSTATPGQPGFGALAALAALATLAAAVLARRS